ncbi:hypothetical protein RND81_12G072200 [Saponaria officinalis]|uniref:HIT-type domain-containing protein n=1 Tax=Saponaria officinalis TaxID=3572 RepID=A0AAW1H7L5_SAPOF
MEDSIATSCSTSSQSHPDSGFICLVCQKQYSQYTCPRCNTRYCSLPCYKSHSLRCTESFMRENVMDEMKQLRPDDQSKKKMMDILKRFHAEDEENSMDEDEMTLSEDTVQKVLSGVELHYEDLSAEEKKLFRRAVTTGELSKLIEPWEPWWLKPSARTISLSDGGARLIQPLVSDEPSTLPQAESTEVPPGPETPLPPLKKLTSVEPSPLLAIHMVDILYSYCFTLRLYNGDWQSDCVGASMVVVSVSSVLGQGVQPESMLEAVSNCLEQTCSPAFRHMGGLQFGFGLLDDVTSLISLGGAALVCALCDLHRMIEAAQRELKFEKPRKTNKTEMKRKLKSAERKVFFIMCWVHEQPEDVWPSLSALINAEKASQLEYRGNDKKSLATNLKTNKGNKSLIEEA